MKNASGDWAASTNGLLSNTQPPRCRWRLYACWPERGRYVMRRAIGFVVCGFTLAACSASAPSLDFLKSSPAKTALRFESVPPGAEVKVSGRTCRTPCELTLEVAELSVTFTRKGYEQQTISVQPEGGVLSVATKFAPNPVHADLVPTGKSAKRQPAPTAMSPDSNAPDPFQEFFAGVTRATASPAPNTTWAEVK